MSEILGERAGISRLEKNIFILMFEFIGFVVVIMFWAMARMLRSFRADLMSEGLITTLMWAFIIFISIIGLHSVYLIFLSVVLRRDEEIKELSSRSYKLNIFIIPKKRVTLRTKAIRSMKPYPISTTIEQVKRIVDSTMLRYICRKLVQEELPSDFKLDMIFKTLKGKEYWGDIRKVADNDMYSIVPEDAEDGEGVGDPDMLEFTDRTEEMADRMVQEVFDDDAKVLSKFKNQNIYVGPKAQVMNFIEKFRERFVAGGKATKLDRIKKIFNLMITDIEAVVDKFSETDDLELQPFLYLFDEPVKIDKEMSFKEVDLLTSEERNILGELGDMFGTAEPKAAIIWKPYHQEENERKIWKYNEVLNDYIPSYIVEGNYFYLGSVAGVPILLDILSIEQLQAFYDARFSVADLNNLKLNALTFLLVALAERWDRRKQTEERNILYSKVAELQSELNSKQVYDFLSHIKKDVQEKKSDYQILPKKIDLSFVVIFLLGLFLGVLLTILFTQIRTSPTTATDPVGAMGVWFSFVKSFQIR